MAQRSYGSITIVDTNDIQRFYVQYAKSNSSATAPSSGWSQTRPEWQNGTYIWQRTVAKRQGVALVGSDYGTPVCITGEKGQQGIQGNTGKGISSIVTTYCNYAQGTPVSSYSGWSSSVPAYDSTKPNYWVKTVVNYTSGNPSTTIYKDLGITEATQKANLAVTTANTAEANSIQAIAIADGKNKIYYANTFNPASDSSVYNNGDTLFYKTNDGTIMYVYDSTYTNATSGHWRQQQFEENAIANLAITNAKINDLHGNKITANTIAGNKIIAHDITANQLATNAIQSSNYTAGTAPYSTAGTFLDLTQGNIYTPNFGVNNTAILENNQIKLNVGAYIKGSIYAYNGTIGSNTAGNNPNYWYIGDYQDYNQNNSALIKGYGTATIQLGNTSTWRLNTNRIHTAWYDDNDSTNSFRLHYLNFNSEYWDLGFHVPTSVSDKFIYIRKTSTENSLAVLQSAINDNANGTNTYWNYQFYVTNDGSLYAKNIYIKDTNGNDVPVGGSDGVYLLKSGGTITGNLQVNGNYLNKNGNALTLQTNLGSTTAGTLTGNTTSAISIGVTGTLPSSNGGTGNTNWNQGGVVYIDGSSPKKLLSTAAGTSGYLLQSNGTGAPTWINPGTLTVAAATKATQDGDGNVIKTTYLPLTGGNVTGPVNFGDSVSIDDLNAGTLVVTGNASFVNNINVDSINGVQVGETPEFTDTVTTVSTTGTGNAITAISASNGAITATKGSTFLTGITSSQVITALGYTPYNATNPNGYTSKQGTVTSVRVQASSPLQSSTSTEQSVSLNTTISFTNQNANVVLAGPSSGSAAAPAFRALVATDIPTLTKSKISDFPTTWALSSVTGADDLKAIEALTGTSGLLKKTAANTWTLDTNTYLTGITSSQVITALGYTPYNATNPNGYTNNTGTVTKVTAGSGLKIDTNTSGGDITTTGTINHINSVTAQTTQALYPIKIDAQGHISAYGSAVTSWALSSITGADDLKAIEALTGTSGLLKKTAANTWTLDTNAYVTSSGVTSITLTQGTGISIGSSGTAITSTGTRTISLADNYGDTKNPYASKTARYVLAAPAAANGVPSFRALTKEDVGLNNVLNYGQITAIGQGDNGTLRVWTGDPTSTSTDDYEDIAITITAYNQSTVSKAGALNLSAAVGSTSKPVYFKADGKPYEISYTIEKSVPSNAVFTDTWNKVSTSQDGYITKLPGNTTTFLRGDGTWGTPVGTTYTFDGTYNASSNKAATVSTVTNAINALDGNLNSTTPGAGKTLTAFSQTDGKVSATFGNISITKSQISDFPSTLTPASHTHGNIQNGGTLQTNDITIGSGDKLIVTDYSDSNKIARTSISFDGSTATKALTQKGTWETFNNYSLPLAANGTRGGVQIGYTENNKKYAVKLDNEKMYVEVPWTDNNTTYSAGTGLSLSGTTFSNSGVTGVKGKNESSYRTGQVNLTADNIGAFENLPYQRGTTEVGVRPLVDQARANRLAFLPADQVIIEKTIDGGTTWEDAEISDDQKRALFVNGTGIPIPLLNGAKSTQCGIRITITAMKYNVPQNTSETQKYNYWNDTYVKSQERYFNVREWWFWISANNDTIKPEIYCSTGANSNNWSAVFTTDFGMTGWSGSDWIRAGSGKTFGGSINQTGNYWNWRLIFWSKFADGKTAFNSTTAQTISTIKCYGDSVWNGSNSLASRDHLYSWDNNQNATFPAQITATQFNGTLNGLATKATGDKNGADITTTYLKLAGGTMTGVLTAKGNLYEDSYSGALNMNNSNIYGLNSIYMADTSENGAEGINFYKDTTHVDSIYAKSGVLYFTPNRQLGTSGTSYSIYHTGNKPSKTDVGLSNVENKSSVTIRGEITSSNITTALGYTPVNKAGDTMTGPLSWNNASLPQFSGSPTYLVGIQGFANGGTMKWQSASSITVGAATKATQDKNGNDITTKYVTIDTEQTISGRKTFSNLAAVTFKPSSGTESCNINYNSSLNALVFSFA